MRDPHVKVDGSELRFQFKGKSGKTWRLQVKDRRVAKIVKACQDLPGQELFQYVDENGERKDVTSADVNAYLKEITGRDITAKDFRTWAGTVLAALALQEFETFDTEAKAKKNVRAAIERVASRLGNTPTICRKCYVHPEILSSYAEGATAPGGQEPARGGTARRPRFAQAGGSGGARPAGSPPEPHVGRGGRRRRAPGQETGEAGPAPLRQDYIPREDGGMRVRFRKAVTRRSASVRASPNKTCPWPG